MNSKSNLSSLMPKGNNYANLSVTFLTHKISKGSLCLSGRTWSAMDRTWGSGMSKDKSRINHRQCHHHLPHRYSTQHRTVKKKKKKKHLCFALQNFCFFLLFIWSINFVSVPRYSNMTQEAEGQRLLTPHHSSSAEQVSQHFYSMQVKNKPKDFCVTPALSLIKLCSKGSTAMQTLPKYSVYF